VRERSGESIPLSKERLPERPLPGSPALQGFPRPGAGASESRATLPGQPARECQVGQLGRPHTNHADAEALASALPGVHGTAEAHREGLKAWQPLRTLYSAGCTAGDGVEPNTPYTPPPALLRPPSGQVGSVGARAPRASAVWFPLRLQAINKLPLGRMRAASKGGFPPNPAGGLRSGPGAGPNAA
jgi:hypothetical protein